MDINVSAPRGAITGYSTLKSRKAAIVLIFAAGFILHGTKLLTGGIGIDTELVISNPGYEYPHWRDLGRWGLLLLKAVSGNLCYNPIFAAVATILVMCAAAIAFLALWDSAWGDSVTSPSYQDAIWTVAAVLWLSHPMLTEQLYFSLQSLEISVCFLLEAISLYFAYRWAIRRDSPLYAVLSTLTLIIPFACYQAMVVMYIFGTISVILTVTLSGITVGSDEALAPRLILWQVLRFAAIFAVSFIANTAITMCLCGTGHGYFDSQVVWGSVPLSMCLRYIADGIIGPYIGHAGPDTAYNQPYYHWSYGLICLASLVAIIVTLARRHVRRGTAAMTIGLWISLQVSTFMLLIIQGGVPFVRTRLVIPAAECFMAYMTLHVILRMTSESRTAVYKLAAAAVSACCIIGCYAQTQVTLRLYYTDSCRYDQDVALARDLIRRIEAVQGDGSYPIVVSGHVPFKPNNSCIIGETMGHSFFDWEDDPAKTTLRSVAWLNTLGARYACADSDAVSYCVTEYCPGLPSWPDAGSVQLCDSAYIVVKLSDAP